MFWLRQLKVCPISTAMHMHVKEQANKTNKSLIIHLTPVIVTPISQIKCLVKVKFRVRSMLPTNITSYLDQQLNLNNCVVLT